MFNLIQSPLVKATVETLYMIVLSGMFSIVFGLALGCFAFLTKRDQALENIKLHYVLDVSINILRSFPFVILLIALIPFTRLIIGTSIGINAAIIPLIIAAIPFYARVCENAFTLVPNGLIEAAHAMGASVWQLITHILLKESYPALVRGSSLLLINLIGYSAMAGTVGGGGLGELAINEGYQRFNVTVMMETVVILVIIVQLVQFFGEKLSHAKSWRPLLWMGMVGIGFSLAFNFVTMKPVGQHTVRVGIIAGQYKQVLDVAKTVAQKKYDLDLEVVTFNDYIEPNIALAEHSIDANIFQHQPYLDAQIKQRHFNLAPIAKTFVYPMGFYSKKINHISELKQHDVVAIANDPSNEARALILLAAHNIIKLKPVSDHAEKLSDIVQNPYHLTFKLLDAAELPRVLPDVSLVAITNDFLIPTGLSLNDAILKENSDSPYANLIVVSEDDRDNPVFKELIAIMHSPEVVTETEKVYPNGAALPAWQD